MDNKKLKKILNDYKNGKIKAKDIFQYFLYFPYKDLKFAKIDTYRNLKFGFPEVIYGKEKKLSHLVKIVENMMKLHSNFIITKVDEKIAKKLRNKFPSLTYFPDAKIMSVKGAKIDKKKGYICVVCAGTSDIPIAEEAAITAEILGNKVERIYDVGVAGIHRLLDKIEILNKAKCIIVVAGMEGALPGVVGGLVGKAVIAVPTSVGYGTNFFGLTPLFTMLNSCSPNVVVVNIDNGFGAGRLASIINQMR